MDSLIVALSGDFLGTPVYLWAAFVAVVVGLLVFDLGVLHRDEREIEARESLLLYGFYVLIALAFGGWVWWERGSQAGLEFYTGYLIEQSLAMDNMFVIATIFGFLGIPGFISTASCSGASWASSPFAPSSSASVRRWCTSSTGYCSSSAHSSFSPASRCSVIRKKCRISSRMPSTGFCNAGSTSPANCMAAFSRSGNRIQNRRTVTWLTPLAVALIMVETVDLIFAVDSVPAVFAVTQDTFIVYTSNIFAVLGLRALYFALAAAMNRFRYLQISLSIILVLIGIKIFLVPLGVHINTSLSLVVTLGILATGIVYSLYKTRNEPDMSAEKLMKHQHAER